MVLLLILLFPSRSRCSRNSSTHPCGDLYTMILCCLCCEAKIVSFDDHLKASCMLNVYLSQYCRIVIQIYTFSTKTTSFIWQYEHFASQLVHQFVKLASILAPTSYALVLTKMLKVHSTMCILRTHRCLSHGGQLRIPRQSTQLVLQAVLGSESQYLSDKILD